MGCLGIPTFLQFLQCFQAPTSVLSPEAGQVRILLLLEPLISTAIAGPAHLTHALKHQHPASEEKRNFVPVFLMKHTFTYAAKWIDTKTFIYRVAREGKKHTYLYSYSVL